MCFSKRACTDSNVLDPHIMDLFHYHIYNVITFTEMVMEADCHTVFDSTFYKDIMDAVYHLASVGIDHTFDFRSVFFIDMSVKMMYTLKYFFTSCF